MTYEDKASYDSTAPSISCMVQGGKDAANALNLRTGWPKCIGCLTVAGLFSQKSLLYGALLREMTYKDKASCASVIPIAWYVVCGTCAMNETIFANDTDYLCFMHHVVRCWDVTKSDPMT